jgi:translation initiation factor 1A
MQINKRYYNNKMVKNTGGNKTKGQARKFVAAPKSNTLRISEDECEVYAQVTKTLGNGMCHVVCIDGVTRLCHIRGKFRGRGKRDNTINNGSWILVGLREWELDKKSDGKKLQNCDLLEVYDSSDKDRLQNVVKNVNWSIFIKNDNIFGNISCNDGADEFKFIDENTEEYQKLIESQISSTGNSTTINFNEEEEINIDDI